MAKSHKSWEFCLSETSNWKVTIALSGLRADFKLVLPMCLLHSLQVIGLYTELMISQFRGFLIILNWLLCKFHFQIGRFQQLIIF